MALQGSGAISINNINVELGKAGTTQSSLGQTDFRTLAGVPSGAISMSNFYGKSNIIYDTTQRYRASNSGGYYVGLTMYTGNSIAIKNPTIHYNMYACNGQGEVSDGRNFIVQAQRVSDGGWDTIWSYYSGWDMENSCDEINTDFTITNEVWYNQFAYTVNGVGQNWHGGDCWVSACYHQ